MVKNVKGDSIPKDLYNAQTTSQQGHKNMFIQGFYKYSVSVVIVKKSSSNAQQKKEIERECYVLKELEKHENFIRFFGYESDENFV